MRLIALLSLLTLSACIGFARSDAEGNVEVVTNWGSFTPGSGTAEEAPAEDDTAPAE